MTYSTALSIVEQFLSTMDGFKVTSDVAGDINYLCEVKLTDVLIKDMELEE